MHKILTITLNPSVDKSTSVASLQPDKKLRCAAPILEPGGGGINVARVLHRFGDNVLPVFFAGGPCGDQFIGLLKAEGLPVSPVGIAGATRENLHLTEEASGRQYRLVMPGPEISADERQAILSVIAGQAKGAGFMVLSGSNPEGIPAAFLEQLAEIARQEKTLLVADISGEGLKQILKAGVYLIKPNLGELARLTGKEELSEAEAIAASREIIAAGGSEIVVVSMGAAGAIMVSAQQVEKIQAPVVKKLSTVGAGDSMVAGIVHALSRGSDHPDAVRFGIACGTAATMRAGTGLCRKTDAEHLYQLLRSEEK